MGCRCFIRDKNGESGCNPDVLYNNWKQWIDECVVTGYTHEEIVLGAGEYLSNRMVSGSSFTAIVYEDNSIVTEDLATYETAEEAIAFAKLHNWDEVVNDITGEVIWKR